MTWVGRVGVGQHQASAAVQMQGYRAFDLSGNQSSGAGLTIKNPPEVGHKARNVATNPAFRASGQVKGLHLSLSCRHWRCSVGIASCSDAL
jgi:hypothetical protein